MPIRMDSAWSWKNAVRARGPLVGDGGGRNRAIRNPTENTTTMIGPDHANTRWALVVIGTPYPRASR